MPKEQGFRGTAISNKTSSSLAGRYRYTLVILMATLYFSCGCAWKGGEGEQGREEESIPKNVWVVAPVKLRIYPSTRIIHEDDQLILEARIEPLDEMDDSIKAVGWVRVELFRQDQAGNPAIGHRLYNWEISLLSLAEQQQYYDPITRSYSFRLRLDEQDLPRQGLILQALFMPIEGDRLEARVRLSQDFRIVRTPR